MSDVLSWKADFHLATSSGFAALEAPAVHTPLAIAHCPAEVRVSRLSLGGKITGAVSLAIKPPKLKVARFCFGQPADWRHPRRTRRIEMVTQNSVQASIDR